MLSSRTLNSAAINTVSTSEVTVLVDSLTCTDSLTEDVSVFSPEVLELSAFVPDKFLSVPMIGDLIGAFNSIVVQPMQEAYASLRNARNKELFEIEFASNFANDLGFFQDISSRTEDEQRRTIDYFSSLIPRNGTNYLFDFLSFIYNESFEIVPLYTKDYITFTEAPGGVLEPNGPWFLTNHVSVRYQSSQIINNAEFTQRFYQAAPAVLYLEQFAQFEMNTGSIYFQGYVHTTYTEFMSTDLLTL